jgi:hypothetical protein
MTIRCAQCGQENNPQYRFCGICGAPLGPPPPVVPQEAGRERVRVPVSGPSFLGLGDERSRDLDYLLEDEPVRGHGRLYFALLLLVVSAGLLAWHWQRDGYPWAGYVPRPAINAASPGSTPASSVPPTPSALPAPDSAGAAAPVVPVQPTANPAPPEVPPVTGESAPLAAGEPTPGSTATPAVASAAKTTDAASLPGDNSDSEEPTSKMPAAAATQKGTPGATQPSVPAAKDERGAAATPVTKTVSPKATPAVPSDAFEDRLVADGERYLYGRGVPEDCARAQRNLQIAAKQSNAKAQTLLGAMYATGHCAGRDLPTAYRWFAQALHGDPSNSRVQRDLEVLWKQMTPEERQLAIRNQ